MKLFVIFVLKCVFFLSAAQAAMTKGDAEKQMREMSKDCMKQLGATADDLNKLIDHQENPSDKMKCLRNCMMRQFMIITPDGKLSKEGVQNLARMMSDDPGMMTIAGEVYENCAGLSDPNPCEAASKYCTCLMEEAMSRKLDFGVM